jgi:hypothetical protein
MGTHVAGDAPDMDRLVDETVAGVGADIEALRMPGLWGVVLGGGYARGEGGVLESSDGARRLYNDLDFYVVATPGASSGDISAVADALAPVSERWTARVGISVDFCAPKTPWRIRHDQDRLMIQELLNGYVDVAGEKGAVMFSGVERRPPSAFPWQEAARMMVNRGAGLLLAMGGDDAVFTARNINKCVLGAGDARLIAAGEYRWKAVERAETLADELYKKAVEWKFRPRAEAPCGWERAREVWLKAADEVMSAGRRSGVLRRSLYQTARWIARRRTLGDLRTLGLWPTARMLIAMERLVRERRAMPPAFRRDWEIFN